MADGEEELEEEEEGEGEGAGVVDSVVVVVAGTRGITGGAMEHATPKKPASHTHAGALSGVHVPNPEQLR